MKVNSLAVALCAVANVWGAAAFVVKAPNAQGTDLKMMNPNTGVQQKNAPYPGGSATERKPMQPIGGANGQSAAMQKTSASQTAIEELAKKNIWATSSPVTVQGSSLRTWSFTTSHIQRVGVFLKSEGRPVNANVELWQGPDNTPQKMSVYIEDGNVRPFSAVVETPGGNNAIAIRNTAMMELPLRAAVEAEVEATSGKSSLGFDVAMKRLTQMGASRTIQGGAIHTYPFAPSAASVQVLLRTDGRPLNARIELLQGPNNQKQVIDIYTEDGLERPFFAVLETPGSGNVVRIINTASLEYPMTASVEPYMVEPGLDEEVFDVGGGTGFFIVD